MGCLRDVPLRHLRPPLRCSGMACPVSNGLLRAEHAEFAH